MVSASAFIFFIEYLGTKIVFHDGVAFHFVIICLCDCGWSSNVSLIEELYLMYTDMSCS